MEGMAHEGGLGVLRVGCPKTSLAEAEDQMDFHYQIMVEVKPHIIEIHSCGTLQSRNSSRKASWNSLNIFVNFSITFSRGRMVVRKWKVPST